MPGTRSTGGSCRPRCGGCAGVPTRRSWMGGTWWARMRGLPRALPTGGSGGAIRTGMCRRNSTLFLLAVSRARQHISQRLGWVSAYPVLMTGLFHQLVEICTTWNKMYPPRLLLSCSRAAHTLAKDLGIRTLPCYGNLRASWTDMSSTSGERRRTGFIFWKAIEARVHTYVADPMFGAERVEEGSCGCGFLSFRHRDRYLRRADSIAGAEAAGGT